MIRLLLVVLVAVFISACSSRPACSSSSCPFGCCDSAGLCQTPNNSACGTSGAACQACPFLQTCQVGACVASSIGGGGGGTSGGGGGTTGGGATGGGTTGGGGGGTISDGGVLAPRPAFRAYRLTFQTAVLTNTCFRSGTGTGSFAPPPLDVLTWDVGMDRFLGLTGPVSYALGESPIVRLPDAIATDTSSTTFASSRNEQEAINGVERIESRQKELRFVFDSLTTSSTTGTLTVRAQFACINGTTTCPMPNPALDSASCEATVAFSATTIAVSPTWFEPMTAVPGATRLFTVWDERPIQNISIPSCYRNNNPPSIRVVEQNVRARRVLQFTPSVPRGGTCSSSNCTGCCTRDGQCLAGNMASACGTGGLGCFVCAFGGTCNVGACSSQGRQLGVGSLSLDGLTVRLGDAPVISPDELTGDEGQWAYIRTTQTPIGTDYTEARQTQVAVTVMPSGTGTAAFNAQYACIRGMTDCPVGNASPADSASCSQQVPIVAVLPP
ncbi:MAG: hypothetical protein JNM17_37280 [Archangium sp.]|nr:hypothetical protein [Archangium sp.]